MNESPQRIRRRHVEKIIQAVATNGRRTKAQAIATQLGFSRQKVEQVLAQAATNGRVEKHYCRLSESWLWRMVTPKVEKAPVIRHDYRAIVLSRLKECGEPITTDSIVRHTGLGTSPIKKALVQLKKEGVIVGVHRNRSYYWGFHSATHPPRISAEPPIKTGNARKEVAPAYVPPHYDETMTQEDKDWFESLRGSRERKQQQRSRV